MTINSVRRYVMFQRIVFCIFMSIGLTVNAQSINLRGTVSNQAGKPIANAIVTLAMQGLKDTTGTDGAYSITKNTGVVLPLLIPGKEGIFLEKGILTFSIPDPSPVKIEIFDVKGNLLKKESVPNVPTGFYRFDIAKHSGAAKLLVIKASIGKREVMFRYLPLKNNTYTANPSVEGTLPVVGKLAKLAAVNDTLKITATGYMANVAAIHSYDTMVNITLDTSGAAGGSSGCGKTPSLKKSTPPTSTKKPSGAIMVYNKVTVAGQSRQYLLWYPDNYDNTHAYRLIFCFHWMTGSASQVFDCTTEGINCYTTQSPFYGLMKLSNNTTIFVAPDGLNAGWANSNGQDLVFTDSMLAQIKNNFCIDTTRIFSCGFSYGGGMSYALACDRPNVFRAVGVFSGGVLSGCKDGTMPVAYYGLHGLDDGTLNISGGRSMRDKFVKNNGCTAQTPPEPAKGSGTHICTTYEGCTPGHPVRWCAFAGSNGHDPSPKDPGQDTTWNPGEVWKFFSQF
jgi:poly(3-hydroxybutyrate) depolymerase